MDYDSSTSFWTATFVKREVYRQVYQGPLWWLQWGGGCNSQRMNVGGADSSDSDTHMEHNRPEVGVT